MNKIILVILVFVIFSTSCSEDKSNNNSDDNSKRDVESISFANRITHQNIDRFISETQINGLHCTILDVSESQDRIEINLELSLDKDSIFIYELAARP